MTVVMTDIHPKKIKKLKNMIADTFLGVEIASCLNLM